MLRKYFIIASAFIISCESPIRSTINAKINDIKIKTCSESSGWMNRGDDPFLNFDISLENVGDKSFVIYVNDSQREIPEGAGSFWLYFNRGLDSLQLYGASCMNCHDSINLEPKSSTELILEIRYADLLQDGIRDSISCELEDARLNEVYKTWSSVKYYDNNRNEILKVENPKKNER